MAVTLNAELGGEYANSYVTMENALGIAQNTPGGGEWSALGE